MSKVTTFILSLILVFSAWPALGQNDLPRVLIIGDSVYSHARGTMSALKGKANVVMPVYPPGFIINSSTAIEDIDIVLSRVDRNGNPIPEARWPKWDLIHFNVGLGDLVHRVPNMKSFRVLPFDAGGVVATELKQYEKNLESLIRALRQQAPDAKLVWANTTPIRHSSSRVFLKGMEVEYNEVAERVMKRNRIPINDMHAYAKSIMNMDRPASHGADPFNFDKKQLHPPIVEIVARELKIKLEVTD